MNEFRVKHWLKTSDLLQLECWEQCWSWTYFFQQVDFRKRCSGFCSHCSKASLKEKKEKTHHMNHFILQKHRRGMTNLKGRKSKQFNSHHAFDQSTPSELKNYLLFCQHTFGDIWTNFNQQTLKVISLAEERKCANRDVWIFFFCSHILISKDSLRFLFKQYTTTETQQLFIWDKIR